MLVYEYGAAEDFIQGSFESVSVEEASRQWLAKR